LEVNIQEIEDLTEDRKVIRHGGQCFLNSKDAEDAARFKELGAEVRVATLWGDTYYEIHLAGLLDPMLVQNEDGEERDTRREFMLEHFRERDGFDEPGLAALIMR
jgi:hypothetical protein